MCRFPNKTTLFHAEFLIRLSAYPNVGIEPQSDVGHNRKKSVLLDDGNTHGRFETDGWPIALPRLSCQKPATCNFC